MNGIVNKCNFDGKFANKRSKFVESWAVIYRVKCVQRELNRLQGETG